jgi:hypothetical protein
VENCARICVKFHTLIHEPADAVRSPKGYRACFSAESHCKSDNISGFVYKNLRPSASLLRLPAHGVASERRADTRPENPALGTRERDGRCAGSRLRAPRHRRGAEARAPARLGCNSQARAAPGGTGAKPVGAAPGPCTNIKERGRNCVTSRHSLMTLGLTAEDPGKNYVTLVTALWRLDLRHETRARPGRQAHPAIATVSGKPPPRNPSL